jgi:hypothetical protein
MTAGTGTGSGASPTAVLSSSTASRYKELLRLRAAVLHGKSGITVGFRNPAMKILSWKKRLTSILVSQYADSAFGPSWSSGRRSR